MSNTDRNMPPVPPVPVESPLSMRDLAAVLVRHYDLHDGSYDLLLEFQIGMGMVGPGPEALTPGAMVGISKVGLIKSAVDGPTTVNAAIINPAKKSSKKAKE
jgi:hypothetical protein